MGRSGYLNESSEGRILGKSRSPCKGREVQNYQLSEDDESKGVRKLREAKPRTG